MGAYPERTLAFSEETLQPLLDRLAEFAKDELEETPEEELPRLRLTFPEGKKFFRIAEVVDLLEVEADKLRHWEKFFGTIRPKKTRSGQRIYDQRDVYQLALVQHLVHVEKYSLEGARKKFHALRQAGKFRANQPAPVAKAQHTRDAQATQAAPNTVRRAALENLADQVRELIALVEAAPV